MPVRVVIIGFGSIGGVVAARLPAGHELAGVLVRPGRVEEVGRALPPGAVAAGSVEELLACRPNVAVECAGQEALAAMAEQVLAAGVDLFAISSGALADDALRDRLAAAARAGGARLVVPAGAIGGLDAVNALRLAGLRRATYESIKPPQAWKDTPAEQFVDLDAVCTRTEVFRGSARDAARRFPKNANLAVTVALAAGDLDATCAVLVADPDVDENIGRVTAEGPLGTLTLELRGPASPDNPRTSAVTGYSVLHALEHANGLLVV